MASRLLSLEDREPNPEAMWDPSSAQFQLHLGQALHDKGCFSSKELAALEAAAKAKGSGQSVTIMNPFTGERRKVVI
jgi:hypothetical protein